MPTRLWAISEPTVNTTRREAGWMVAVDLLLKATEWGLQVVNAANTKAQKRTADIVEKSAMLVAGLQHMDARFTELFVPLVFYDAGSWPIERRRSWAEEALSFIHGDRVVDRLGQAITYLESTQVDDRQLAALVQDLCDITHIAMWGNLNLDITAPDEGDDVTDYAPRLSPQGTSKLRVRVDPDDLAAPAVSTLVNLMRTESPDPQQVARAASACLVGPRGIRPDNYGPTLHPPALRHFDPDRQDRDDLHRPMQPDDAHGQVDEQLGDEEWPQPLNTVSPLRDFADNAGRRFQQILSVARASFPGLPEPAWLWNAPR